MINSNTKIVENKKSSVDIKIMEMCSCTKSTLLFEKIYNGRFYHATDTNEFFFDWNDKRYLLNWINPSDVNEINLSESAIYRENILKLNNDNEYIDIKSLKKWLDENNYKQCVDNELCLETISDDSEVIISIQELLSHIRGEIELFNRNKEGKYLDKNGSVISEPYKNLDKLVERNSLLKTDIELLIEKNKIYWGGDLDF